MIDAHKPGHPERPIVTSAEDVLSRAGFIERLGKALINPETKLATGVVVGLSGPWGSGKSSLLNLLHEHISEKYETHAVVVRFNPWLISGRNDLVAEFMREVLAAINTDATVSKKLKKFASAAADYGVYLAPLISVTNPVPGASIEITSKLIKDHFAKSESLNALRHRLEKALNSAAISIVVLIDEVDRVEDGEVRAIAQLVRSIADFRGISYVLAYDGERVIEALGAGVEDPTVRRARGRAYLEKIVQLQVAVPICLPEELEELFEDELDSIKHDVHLPENYKAHERYVELKISLFHELLVTPRDVKRFIGTFHVQGSMIGEEVDWIDSCDSPFSSQKLLER